MNRFKKHNGAWCIQCDGKHASGDVVDVILADGRVKQVTVGDCVGFNRWGEIYTVATPPAAAVIPVGDCTGVLNLFKTAQQHLKYPAIVLHLPNDARGVRVTVAGAKAKAPGSLTVTSRDRRDSDEQRDWFGRVMPDGTFQPSREAPAGLASLLARLASDPVGVASEHGRLTGCCCFCNRALADERSTAVGYGATCASNFGLPWGTRPAAFGQAA